jgi:ABC-2 type transport system ATP-binding protein
LWEVIEQLVDDGTTVLLTTQYLEEADQLADRIAVIDHGTLIAEGTSEELKARVGGDVLELEVADPSRLLEAADVVAGLGSEPPTVDGFTHRVKLPISDPVGMIAQVVRDLDARSIGLRDLAIHRPTLDDVFLTLTGKPAVDETEEEPPLVEAAAGRRSRR